MTNLLPTASTRILLGKIARQFVTAKGDVRENGATAIIMAQMANAETRPPRCLASSWASRSNVLNATTIRPIAGSAEQFHQLAAFFPRIGVRPRKKGEDRTFEVVSIDRPKAKSRQAAEEATLEHHMPDLNHPEHQGTAMKPVFFVTGQHLQTGVSDHDRRETIANWITPATIVGSPRRL